VRFHQRGVARALDNLYHDERRRQQLARAAFENAQRPECSWDIIAEQCNELFGELKREAG
jgi:hypothetical protein